jgi:glucuronate isomerase
MVMRGDSVGLMSSKNRLVHHPDRLLGSVQPVVEMAREMLDSVSHLPILSPHGHTDPAWFATNENFANATELFLAPDHYLYRMLYSQGISLDALGVGSLSGPSSADPEAAWALFAQNYHLFRGTPSRQWMDHVFYEIFGFEELLSGDNHTDYYQVITKALAQDDFKPRALFERFGIEVLATTEGAVDQLEAHQSIRDSGWKGRVISAYRPDSVVDPQHEFFNHDLRLMSDLTGESLGDFTSYLRAHQIRRRYFINMGATSTDHGHPSAATLNLSAVDAETLYQRVLKGNVSSVDAEAFRAQMLTEMARMSLEDGLVMQIHPGAYRNHNRSIFDTFGRDKGADVPSPTEYVRNLKPLLDEVGNEAGLTIIVFTLDETNYSRELAPLAGHYPALKLGPAWWFHDCPEGMWRFREQVTPVAGFYNTVGFNDDTRAFFSIPARHDMARRIDARYLASLVCDHRINLDEGFELMKALTYDLPKSAYKL